MPIECIGRTSPSVEPEYFVCLDEDQCVVEGEQLTFRLFLKNQNGDPIPAPDNIDVQITFQGSQGSAADFSAPTLPPGIYTIPQGQSFYSLTLDVLLDNLVEGTEDIPVQIAGVPAGYQVGSPSTQLIQLKDAEKTDFPASVDAGTFNYTYFGPALPPEGQSSTDPNTGVTTTCIGTVAPHSYSTKSPWSSDCSKILLEDGLILDADTFNVIGNSPFNTEATWSHNNPDILYGIHSASGELGQYNCATGSLTLSGVSATGIGTGEGYIATDETIVLGVGGSQSSPSQLCHYDLSNFASPVNIGCISTPSGFDSAKISMSGDCIFVDTSSGGFIYDRGFQNLKDTTDFNPGHGMWGYDCNGDEVLVYKKSPNGGGFSVYVVGTGNEYQIFEDFVVGFGSHMSYATSRPGWMYISDGFSGDPLNQGGFIGAMEICQGTNTVEPWTDGHVDQGEPYAGQPKASVSNDGTKIIFTSDNNSDGVLREYVASCTQSTSVPVSAS